jgi:hypothetical protein
VISRPDTVADPALSPEADDKVASATVIPLEDPKTNAITAPLCSKYSLSPARSQRTCGKQPTLLLAERLALGLTFSESDANDGVNCCNKLCIQDFVPNMPKLRVEFVVNQQWKVA